MVPKKRDVRHEINATAVRNQVVSERAITGDAPGLLRRTRDVEISFRTQQPVFLL